MYFIIAGIFICIGIVGAIMVEMRDLPKSATYVILLATFGHAGKQLMWYCMDRKYFANDDADSQNL